MRACPESCVCSLPSVRGCANTRHISSGSQCLGLRYVCPGVVYGQTDMACLFYGFISLNSNPSCTLRRHDRMPKKVSLSSSPTSLPPYRMFTSSIQQLRTPARLLQFSKSEAKLMGFCVYLRALALRLRFMLVDRTRQWSKQCVACECNARSRK